jgi:hypothetical protein
MKTNHIETLCDMLAAAITAAQVQIPPLMVMPRGCIIGAATVTGWCDDPPEGNPWAVTSGLVIEGAEMFAPIMCKGALGFFKPKLEALA